MLCYVCYASFVSQDIPDQEIAEHLKTEDKEPPHLIIFKHDGEVTASFVVGDGVSIMTEKSVSAATLVLIATYYLFNMEYPKIYSQLLGILQTQVVRSVPYEGKKSSKYSTFNTLLKRKMVAMERQASEASNMT